MIIEAVCAVSYLLAFMRYGFSLQFAAAVVLFAVLIVLSGIDIDHYEIPYWCSISVAVMGIAAFFLFKEIVWWERLVAMGVVGVLFVILVLIGGMGGCR